MKKKKVIPLIVLVVLFAALLVSYTALKKYNKEQEETTGEASESIISCESGNVLNISVTNPSGTMEFAYDISTSEWKYAADSAFPLDTTKINTLLGAACTLNASRRLEDTLDNISEYGLDNPVYTLTITGDEGIDYTLYVGNTSSTGNYYTYLEGESTVYMIDSTLPDSLALTLNDMAKLEEIPAVSSSDVYELEINGITYVYYENGNPQYDYTNSNNWFEKMSDGTYRAVDTTQINNILTSLTGIAYNGCADYNVNEEELKEYGLDAANAKKIVEKYYVTESNESESGTEAESGTEETTKDTTVKVPHELTFYVGNKDAEGNYYVKTADGTAVNTVAADTIDAVIGVLQTELISKNAFSINADSVQSLTVTANGKTYNIVENGEITDADKYQSVREDIDSISAESVITDASTVQQGQPELTVVYKLNSEYFDTVTMEYTKYNGSYYQVSINGKTELLVVKSTIENIINKLQEIEP